MGVGEPVGDGGPYAREHGAGSGPRLSMSALRSPPDTYSTTM